MSATDSPSILVIHGPNMNLLGKRTGENFGTLTLDKVDRELRRKATDLEVRLKIYQRNGESDIVTLLQRQRNWADGILLNPGALCFTSFSIADTLTLIKLPTVEVHIMAHIAGRPVTESVLAPFCTTQQTGLPKTVYGDALEYLVNSGIHTPSP